LSDRLTRLRATTRLGDYPPPREAVRPRRSILGAVITILASCGDLRARDVHAAVEGLLGESVPVSSVKNCLAQNARGEGARFKRVGRGRYCLTGTAGS
jgi:hypothetical protein